MLDLNLMISEAESEAVQCSFRSRVPVNAVNGLGAPLNAKAANKGARDVALAAAQ